MPCEIDTCSWYCTIVNSCDGSALEYADPEVRERPDAADAHHEQADFAETWNGEYTVVQHKERELVHAVCEDVEYHCEVEVLQSTRQLDGLSPRRATYLERFANTTASSYDIWYMHSKTIMGSRINHGCEGDEKDLSHQ